MTLNKWSVRIALGVVILLLLSLGTAWALQQQGQADMAGSASLPTLHVASSSFADGDSMPPRLTCDGLNLSPNIQLPSPPTGTKSFVIVMDDPDAPSGFTHWLAYNISADTRDLAEGASGIKKHLDHGAEGVNSFGNIGYGGPCPPEGNPHHYVFHVYALDVNPALQPGNTRQVLAAVVKGHILAEGQITGLYGR